MVQLDPVAGEACHEQRTVQAQRARCESTGSLLGVSVVPVVAFSRTSG
jgi:hypothetical protein